MISINDEMIIFDNNYMVDIKKMVLSYAFFLTFDEKTIVKEYLDVDKRNKYLKEIEKYVNEKQIEKENKIKINQEEANEKITIIKKELAEQLTDIEKSYTDDVKELVSVIQKKY